MAVKWHIQRQAWGQLQTAGAAVSHGTSSWAGGVELRQKAAKAFQREPPLAISCPTVTQTRTRPELDQSQPSLIHWIDEEPPKRKTQNTELRAGELPVYAHALA